MTAAATGNGMPGHSPTVAAPARWTPARIRPDVTGPPPIRWAMPAMSSPRARKTAATPVEANGTEQKNKPNRTQTTPVTAREPVRFPLRAMPPI